MKTELDQLKKAIQRKDAPARYETTLKALSSICEHVSVVLDTGAQTNIDYMKELIQLHRQLQFLSQNQVRDHIIHSLHVFLIGMLFLLKSSELKNLWQDRIRTRIEQLMKARMKGAEARLIKKILDDYFAKNRSLLGKMYGAWILTSLFHDIGYIVLLLKMHMEKHFPRFEFGIEAKSESKKTLDKMRRYYSSLLSRRGSRLDLKKCEREDDHGYLSAVFMAPQRLIDVTLPDSILSLNSIFAMRFHNRPYLSPVSPLLQLLVFADSVEELERYLPEGKDEKLMTNLDKECVVISGTDVRAILDFKSDAYSMDYFRKLRESLNIPRHAKKFFERKSFAEFYNRMRMNGLEFRIICHPPTKDPCRQLLFCRECGRSSAFEQEETMTLQPADCAYCKS